MRLIYTLILVEKPIEINKNVPDSVFTNLKIYDNIMSIKYWEVSFMLKVLVAEDNVPMSVQISNMINTDNVRCVGILNNGSKVYQKLKDLKPDILILDLKLPGSNGLEILQKIEVDKSIKTKVFVYSGDMTYITLSREFKCVERFYSKLTPLEQISRELENLVDTFENKSTGDKVSDILFKLGFSYSLKGTRLISECIVYSITENEDKINRVYTAIAKRKKENINTIKADINTAVNNMWRYSDDRNKVRRILRLGSIENPSSKRVITMVKYYINN